MNVDRDLERRLTDLYSAEANVRAPDRVLTTALETIDNTHQRRRLIRIPWAFPRLNTSARLALAAVVVVAVGTIGLATFRPTGTRPGALASASPTPSPRSFPTPDSSGNVGPLQTGRYALTGFPVGVSLEVPAGWQPCIVSALEQGVCAPGTLGMSPGINFLIIENVVSSPCSETLRDPPVGPTVDDLVEAISSLDGFEATAPVDVVVDGYAGKKFDIAAPRPAVCDLKTWATVDRVNGVGAGETNILRVIDVDGARVLIAGAYFPGINSQETRSTLEGIAASIQINP
jgi:hypothetical protein